jgi:hypothetical protein
MFRYAAACVVALTLTLAACSDESNPIGTSDLLETDGTAANGGSGTTYIDLDYSPKLSDAGENQFLTTVLRADGTYETYLTGSEGSDRQLMATTDPNGGALKNNLLSDLVGQAFGPNVAGKGNDFAFCRDAGSKVQCWSGEQTDGEIKYHQRNKKEFSGEFVSVEFSPKLSASDYNAFLVSVDDGGTTKTYQYNSENNTPNHAQQVDKGGLVNDLVGQAFGPDVTDKQNDFAFCRDIGSKVQCWIGEQKDGEIEYFNRQRFEVSGEFVDLDYSLEFSTSTYNAFVLVVEDGGTEKAYQYNTEGGTPGHKSLITTSDQSGLMSGMFGQALGPDVANKGNDFRWARDLGSEVQYWIGEQKDGDLKYHQRGRFEL